MSPFIIVIPLLGTLLIGLVGLFNASFAYNLKLEYFLRRLLLAWILLSVTAVAILLIVT